jgi:hypothetical protein
MAKITLATVKRFVKANRETLLISTRSHFDGMIDCVTGCADKSFSPVQAPEHNHENTLGIKGAWLVFGSRDRFSAFETDELTGIEVYNCCGHFVLAVARTAVAA